MIVSDLLPIINTFDVTEVHFQGNQRVFDSEDIEKLFGKRNVKRFRYDERSSRPYIEVDDELSYK